MNKLKELRNKLEAERKQEHNTAIDELRLYKLLQETQESIYKHIMENIDKEVENPFFGSNFEASLINYFTADNYILMIDELLEQKLNNQ